MRVLCPANDTGIQISVHSMNQKYFSFAIPQILLAHRKHPQIYSKKFKLFRTFFVEAVESLVLQRYSSSHLQARHNIFTLKIACWQVPESYTILIGRKNTLIEEGEVQIFVRENIAYLV